MPRRQCVPREGTGLPARICFFWKNIPEQLKLSWNVQTAMVTELHGFATASPKPDQTWQPCRFPPGDSTVKTATSNGHQPGAQRTSKIGATKPWDRLIACPRIVCDAPQPSPPRSSFVFRWHLRWSEPAKAQDGKLEINWFSPIRLILELKALRWNFYPPPSMIWKEDWLRLGQTFNVLKFIYYNVKIFIGVSQKLSDFDFVRGSVIRSIWKFHKSLLCIN